MVKIADRSVALKLSANVSGLVAGLKTGQRAVKDFDRDLSAWAKKNEASLDDLGNASMVMGGAVAAGVGLAVKGFADFDKQMSSVKAATHETEANMKALREAAIEAGADTAFSAAEAAQGIEEMAKAGVSTKDILSGGLNGALSLAAAGAISVGEAAETSASAMTQFKLSGEDIPHIADLLAAGAGKAQGSVSDMGAALNQAGLIAAQTGLTIEETTGGLAAFASAGLTGSDAGTSFKTMLQAVTPNSEKAAKAMDELGISAYDSQGNFIGLSEYAGVLKTSLSDMTAEQRNSTLETIFGSDAVRAAAVLYEQGAEGVQKWEDAVNDAGYAAETAAIMQDNLAGDIEKLGGSLDSVFLKSGSGANEVLRGLAQGAEGFIDAIGDIPEPVLNIGLILAGIAGSGALAAGGIMKVLPRIVETREAFDALAPAGGKARGAIEGVGKAAGVAAVALAGFELAKAVNNDLQPALMSLEEMNQSLLNLGDKRGVLSDVFKGLEFADGDQMTGEINGIYDAFAQLTSGDVRKSLGRFGADVLGVENGFSILRDAISNADQVMSLMVQDGNMEDAAAGFREAANAAAQNGEDVTYAAAQFPAYMDALRETASATNVAVSDTELLEWALTGIAPAAVAAAQGATGAKGQISDVGTAAEQAAEQTDDLVDSLLAINNVNLSASEAQLGFDQAIKDAAENAVNAGAGIDYLNEKTGEFNQTAADNLEVLNGIASQGNATAEAVYNQTGSYDSFRSSLESSRTALFDVAKGYFATEAAAWDYVDSVLSIPPEMTTKVDISDDGSIDGIRANLSLLADAISGTPDKTVIIDEPMSPAIRAKLEELGYVVTNLPDGTIQVKQNGAAPTQAQIEGVANKPYNATVNANAETGAAEAELNHTARNRSSTVTQTVLKTEHTRYTGETALDRLGGTKKATGGAVFGPGTGTSDDIPAWLSNGEHVLTAAEVEKLGGHGAVYNLRAMAMRGDAPKFAAGGRVSWARTQQDREWREWDRLRRTKPKDTGKNDAQIRRHEDRIRKARDEYEAAKDRTQRLIEDERDLKTDLRRGNIREQFASGSGMSIVDQMFEESRNTDLSRNQRNNLARTASSTERQLLSLERRADSLAGKLETAKSRYDDLVSVRDSVAGGLRDEFSLQGAIDDQQRNTFKPVTARSLRDAAWGKADQMRAFALKLEALRKKGYNAAIIQEVAGMGMDAGTLAADALLSGANWERDSLNKAYGSMDYWSREAGINVTESMYKGGVNAAQGVVRGLESQTKTVETAFYNLGVAAEKAFKRSLDIRSPSRLLEKDGINAVLGIESGVEKRKPYLEAAMGDLMQPGSYGSWGAANIARPVASVMSNGGGDQHFHIDAKPGLAYEYAHTVAVETAVKVKDTMTAYSL